MNILAIETSCDETAAAIVQWHDNHATVLANTVSSQASLHAKWGGVVPNLASREHVRNIVPVIEETLARAELKPEHIDLIAVTQGPGLMPALLVGVSAAKTLALVWNKPLIGIHHLEGHIYANFVSPRNNQESKAVFPLVALIVSGGHTQLMLMLDHFQYELLGETQDDAAGEAFDKAARLLGLGYPGGPVVAKRADQYRIENQELRIKESIGKFPRPMLNSDDFNFSFSGLKTAVLYFLRKHEAEKNDGQFIDMVCHEFQEAVVDVLVSKTKKALERYAPETFVIAGGVSANVHLREQLQQMIAQDFPNTQFLIPEFTYSLDNAAMIGVAAAYRYESLSDIEREKLMKTYLTLDPNANLPLR